jgi:hypothetical protein
MSQHVSQVFTCLTFVTCLRCSRVKTHALPRAQRHKCACVTEGLRILKESEAIVLVGWHTELTVATGVCACMYVVLLCAVSIAAYSLF